MSNASKIGMAVVGGYVLGRTKKAKLAIMLGGALAGRKLNLTPAGVVSQASKVVAGSPELTRLSDAVRGRLFEAGKQAAVSAAGNRLEALTNSLVERVENLGKPVEQVAGAAGDAAGAGVEKAGDTAGAAVEGAGAAAGAAGDTAEGATDAVGDTTDAVGDAAGEAPVVGRAAKGATRAAGSATRGTGRAVAGTTSKARRPRSADADSEDPPRRRTGRPSGSGSSSGRAGSSSRSSDGADSDSEGRAAPARRTARSSSGRSSESSSSSSSGSSGKGGSRNGRAPRSGGRATKKSEARADG
ncbi:hypothetical protein [Pseudonocardia sp. ICBG1034]|uniref:hypothetical protein n=1 Tax=Pseudonocardia sp. ICBG1034 TaxID=2844381 RepID=UPI001CCF66FC|nr:hypothetical protein [Pseudonocardia sp. ICBG1034]